MLKIEVDKGIERALKMLKNKVRNTKLVQELRDRREFTKPSVKKRNQKKKAIYIDQKYRQNED